MLAGKERERVKGKVREEGKGKEREGAFHEIPFHSSRERGEVGAPEIIHAG